MENFETVTAVPFKTAESVGQQIVCIGASAGGMEAIHELFDNMPQSSGFSFIVIQHLSSEFKSLMGELLAKHTTMKVVEAQDGLLVEPDSVYVIPNNRNLTIQERRLYLTEKKEGRSPNMPIDVFLESLARDVGNKSVAVILSGTGTDGTKGIADIKRAGGLVFAQDPATAKFDGMPFSAIASGNIDFILSPESIAEEMLMQYKAPPAAVIVDTLPAEDEPMLLELFNIIQTKTGSDFSSYKRQTIIRRLTRRMAFLNYKSLNDYTNLLKKDQSEVETLQKEFLIGVTRFFRDVIPFEELKLKVIPEIINSKTGSDSVKIWSAACSTGEEAYSIAILIKEHFKRLKIDLDVKIFASDTNKESIDFASKGSYPESIAADVPRELLDQYFIREGKKYKVVPQIRKMIVFSHHDLLKDPPFGRLDLVCCRNMLIYLSPHLQRRVMSVFHFALNMGGYLFLGPSETIGELKESMIEVSKKWKIYKNVKPAKSIGLDTLPYTDQVNRKFTHPGTTVHKELSRKGIVESVLNKVLEECALAGALVDSNCNILETFGDYRKYLHLPEKKFDHNLLKMLPARTSIIIAANFRQAIVSQEKQIVKSLPLKKSQPPATITIKPFKDHFNNTVALVLFKDVAVTEQKETVEVSNGQRFHEEVVPDFHHFITLQNELRETKEILQKAIEEAETTNEELQSSNEELISSNEELQSANEELQSLNEELHTVNAENQMKIKEISELNDDLNNYFRSTHIGQVFVDRSLLIRKYTPAATALINLIETDVGRPINHISNNIAYTGLVNDIHHVLKTAESVDKTIEDEHDTCYQMKILPYLREGKYIDGAVLIFVNITAIKKAEKALEKANADLKELNETLLQSNKELEQFAYITSHDLQEPLRKIQTFADLTARNILDQDASKKYLEKINQSAIRMSLLIKDILSYSRLTLSNESFCDVSLGNLLKSVVEDFELLIEQKQATVIIDVRHIVRGVPLQLHQLFSNLLSNSLKFCERNPEITIVTAPVSAEEVAGIPELSPRNEYIRISFSDNGIGFEQEYATKIFTIFQRLHHRKLYAGTGIGLALCKRIVEKHQGTIFASSKIDCGATFTIYLVAA